MRMENGHDVVDQAVTLSAKLSIVQRLHFLRILSGNDAGTVVIGFVYRIDGDLGIRV